MTRRYCLTLDLKDDPASIAEYKRQHQSVWPEITQSIRDAGIEDLSIYLLGTVLTALTFSPAWFFVVRFIRKFASGKSSCGNFSKRYRKPSPAKSGC